MVAARTSPRPYAIDDQSDIEKGRKMRTTVAAVLASETTSTGSDFWGHVLELGVVISTLMLVVVTVGLWKATAQVHHDEVMKMSGELSHANDNMTEVALAEIDAHAAARQRMQQVRRARRHGGRRH